MYNIAKNGETKAEVSHVEYVWAFVIGGAICVVGQLLIDFTKLTPARILVLFVTLGVVLTALGLYEPLVDLAGAGATVPLTGFGYTMAKGTMEAVKQHGLLGAFSGGLTASAAGIAAAVVFGYLAALLSKPGDKS
jgi:stage V sporulation protein AE